MLKNFIKLVILIFFIYNIFHNIEDLEPTQILGYLRHASETGRIAPFRQEPVRGAQLA